MKVETDIETINLRVLNALTGTTPEGYDAFHNILRKMIGIKGVDHQGLALTAPNMKPT